METSTHDVGLEDLYALEDVHLEDSWRHDEQTGLWRCGEVAIALRDDDRKRYFIFKPGHGTAERQVLFGGHVPPSGMVIDDLAWFGQVLASDANGPVPTAGLQPWLDQAQVIVDVLLDEEAELVRQEREEWESKRVGRTAAELLDEVPEETDWIVPGVLVPGWATKLAGREKGGKGTLTFYLLGKLESGEETVFGPSKQVTALILTEEPEESVREKVAAFGLRRARIVYGWELAGQAWPDKVSTVVREALADGHRIVFVDNISRSASVEKEEGVELARAVERLQDACRKVGIALIVDHHHKKGRDSIENKSRGGTAFPGALDINVELERIGPLDSRKRRLTARGRLRATNWKLAVELTADGTDYVTAEDAPEVTSSESNAVAQRWGDTETLRKHGPLTAAEFAPLIKRKEQAARNRLNELVAAGFATKTEGELTNKGRGPNVYEAKAIGSDDPKGITDATDGSGSVTDA